MKAYQAITSAVECFQKAGVPTPTQDAWKLLNHAGAHIGKQSHLLRNDELDATVINVFHGFVCQRAKRKPVSQIVGERWFYNHVFEVNDHVLDPRPESELLVKVAIGLNADSVLDLGVGSGCLLLSILLECPNSHGIGIDCCPNALDVARKNADRLECANRAGFYLGNWFDDLDNKFDLIVSNPPYISVNDYELLDPEVRIWEPKLALTSGKDGLEAYKSIASGARARLNMGGTIVVEIGHNQLHTVSEIFTSHGFELQTAHYDTDCRPRALELK